MPRLSEYRKWLKQFQKGASWPLRAVVVSVVWHDATYAEELERSGTVKAVTFGVVVEATKDHIKTCAEIFEDKTVRDVTTIPAGMVERVFVLGEHQVP